MAQQTVLIAGATGNIGFAAAVALAKRGVRVVLLGRREEKLRAKAEQLTTRVSNVDGQTREQAVELLVVDLADLRSVRRAADEAMQRFAAVDGIVHSVGVFLLGGPRVLANGPEAMFVTNVLGPFVFTELLVERMAESGALVVHVIAQFDAKLDWSDLESIADHRPMIAFNRTKICNRMIAGEMSRRYAGRVSRVAFDPTFVIDQSDPELASRWPRGLTGMAWGALSRLMARPPEVAGEPLADLYEHSNRSALNGKLYRLAKQASKPDAAMHDAEGARKLWDRLVQDGRAPSGSREALW